MISKEWTETMENRPQTTGFVKQDCVHCQRAKETLRDAGMMFFASHDVEAEQRDADAAVYFSGKSTVPQFFIGDYPVGGADDLEELWKTRRLRDIVRAVDPDAVLGLGQLSDEELAKGAEDVQLEQYLSTSDGTHSDDPEQWPILRFYKQLFGFWPNTFTYMHHWPELYKRFVYCQNMSAIGSKDLLGLPMISAVGYSTSNAHGCNYCQVHSVATAGDASIDSVEQLRLARIGQREEGNPFDEYFTSLADLAAMSSLNEVPEHYVGRLHRLAAESGHPSDDVQAQIVATALISASFGFLNVFNDLVGMEIEGGWASMARERLDMDNGRHAVNDDENPDNLSHNLPEGGPSPQELMGKYAAQIGDFEAYSKEYFGVVLPWVTGYPDQMRPLHVALYDDTMRQQNGSSLTPELKHLLAYVSHVEKGHVALAEAEALIAHHVSEDKPATIRRLRHAFAVASGRGEGAGLFTESERAALQLAYLSAQTPLITPRRFVQPVLDNFDEKTCIELFIVCGIASMVQRFVAIVPPTPNPSIEAFVAEHELPANTLAMRFPLPKAMETV